MSPPRTIFMGTADLACASLEALAGARVCELVAVISQPDKPKGRDLKLQPTPVKAAALGLSLPVLQPARAREPSLIAELAALQPDLIVVAAYGQILPQPLLDLPRHGCLNVHTSLLPRHRGAAPIQWAILENDAETGVTIMQMEAGLDTGPIVSTVRTPIHAADDAQTLHDRLARMGGELLVRTIPDYLSGSLHISPQPADGATYARKLTREDGRLDWTQPARRLWCQVRAFTPWPGAFTCLPAEPKPRLLKFWKAEPASGSGAAGTILEADKAGLLVACGQDALRVTELQPEGKRRMTAQEFLAGHPLRKGDRFLSETPD
jgi:methionyl-tRNA formyltransferase